MDIGIRQAVIELEAQAVLPLHEASGTRVTCLEGVLWITQDNDRNDIILEAGQSFTIGAGADALVQALRASRMAVAAPGPARQPLARPGLVPAAA
jgi:quercetin dioxygenase-like cupin family protein